METPAYQAGRFFLDQTILQDTVPSSGTTTESQKTCGICEPSPHLIHLPNPPEIPMDPVLLGDIMEMRRTVREYSNEDLKKWELSLMLHYTQGISEEGGSHHLRNVPAAGGLHPFETYIVVNRVDGLEPGIYRYLPLDHALVRETCHVGGEEAIAASCRRPELVKHAAVTFVWIAVPDRILWKFGSRGWRYLFIEAGHICQNLYLIATALGCGTCAIGSYHDDKINCALGIDGVEQFCIYLATVGKRKEI
ncbi:MAG: SagB/ThcOx family dehydrogenase [Methanospirillum sp.]|uniref:SagB/ThcOx family dehydrogenase n=1 Tax=Methanospirillum sp. TaxID=45200 RepID=UPI0023722BBB|nr:SagB/ThcOx family dehydrogenase [Methanospirillum sp.]MDD1728508.1 SagB/ThcOx family dehydrogenase [Methanospirillum sp.]